MYCTQCGNLLADTFAFCPRCGAPVVKDTPVAPTLHNSPAAAQEAPVLQPLVTRTAESRQVPANASPDPTAIPVVPVYLQQREKKKKAAPQAETEAAPIFAPSAEPAAAPGAAPAPDAAEPAEAFPLRPIMGSVPEPFIPSPQPAAAAKKPRAFSALMVVATVFFGIATLLGLIYTLSAPSILSSWEYVCVALCAAVGFAFCLAFRQHKSLPYLFPIAIYFVLCCYAPLSYLLQGYSLNVWITVRFCLNLLSFLLVLLFYAFPSRTRLPLFIYLLVQTVFILLFNVRDMSSYGPAMLRMGQFGEFLRILCSDLMDYTILLGAAFATLATRKRMPTPLTFLFPGDDPVEEAPVEEAPVEEAAAKETADEETADEETPTEEVFAAEISAEEQLPAEEPVPAEEADAEPEQE